MNENSAITDPVAYVREVLSKKIPEAAPAVERRGSHVVIFRALDPITANFLSSDEARLAQAGK